MSMCIRIAFGCYISSRGQTDKNYTIFKNENFICEMSIKSDRIDKCTELFHFCIRIKETV